MTLSEFKAWFEGFTEGMEGAPTADQFAKIKAKVEKIDGAVTTYPIFVDRWLPHAYGFRDYRPYWSGGNVGYATSAGNVSSDAIGGTLMNLSAAAGNEFDGHAAMRDLGRMEALN